MYQLIDIAIMVIIEIKCNVNPKKLSY